MIILHHVLHFLILALSGAVALISLFARNNMKLKKIEADIEALKAVVAKLDGQK